ncbi:tetratricopeptide repeat-containing sensor histidine kinase [Puia sp. P3]|uniref:tetratricopeptide repeat-containing sensor histidine kinase n=1 Tax=Puia sp. P3 TaxID=3423952 RepID=UPI003D664EB6
MLQPPVHIRILLCLLLLVAQPVFAQNRRIDSMENDLRHPKDDTFRLALLGNLAVEYFGYDTVKGWRYLDAERILAEKMHYLYYIGDYYAEKAKMVQSLRSAGVVSLEDSAIFWFGKHLSQKPTGLDLAQTLLSIATCQGQKGNVLAANGQFREAIAAYLEAMKAWKESDDPKKNEAIATYYANISTVYYDLKQIDKALEYDEAGIPYRLADGNEELLAMAYIYVADDLVSLGRVDPAQVYLDKAAPIVEKLDKPGLNSNYYSKQGYLNRKLHRYPAAVEDYGKALTASRTLGSPFKLCSQTRALAECHLEMKEYDAARKELSEALAISNENGILKEKQLILRDLMNVEENTHHEAQAYLYLKQADTIGDSLKSIESKTAIAGIEAKYQAAEREKEIDRLQGEKQLQTLSIKHQSTLNYVLFGSIGFLLLLGFLIYRNYRQKQQLQQQTIGQLEKDKQLMAVNAMLRGQEEERSRLAKDLHDGLGGMLSGVKYSLSNIRENLIVTPDNIAVYERSLDMIDSSIRELRRVAHNMMPEMLMKFGLDEALREYCQSVSNTRQLTVRYQSFGFGSRLDSQPEIIVYRIVQEAC